jgi:hypothetical protein
MKDNYSMTDTIKSKLTLTKIAAAIRKGVDTTVCHLTDLNGQTVGAWYVKPIHRLSPLSGTGMESVTRCTVDPKHSNLLGIPHQLDAEINVPNATVGHNLLHGTSVYKAGIVALELQRIWLAHCGLPKTYLDLLGPDDVSMDGVTITYLLRFSSPEVAQRVVAAIKQTGKVLNSKCTSFDSTNLTVKLPYRTFTVQAYIKTDLSTCKFPEGAPVDDLVSAALCIVRIEVKLGLAYLSDANLTALTSWRDANKTGLYESIFNSTVRGALRLGQLRHKAPREEVFQRLTPTAAALLRWYLDGHVVHIFPPVLASKSPAKRISALKRQILNVAKVDVDIPWDKHVQLRCFELDDQLIYPGNFEPSADAAPWCFCDANWGAIRQRLRKCYRSALAASAAAIAAATVTSSGTTTKSRGERNVTR